MKIIASLFFSLLTIFSFGQEAKTLESPEVDKRIEILSIVFRLAGNKEYNANKFKLYTDRIENYFSPYKNHELIQFVKKISKENNIGYDAVMSMAIHIDSQLNPLIEYTDTIPDQRWGKDNANRFVQLLKMFYEETNCEQFFHDNNQLYREASNRFLPIYNHLNLNWYAQFYGKEPSEKFVIRIGLGNGGSNYGPSILLATGEKDVYAIMGTWEMDSLGMPIYRLDEYFPTLVHEFNHSFVNYLLDKDPEPFEKNGETIFDSVSKEMQLQAYKDWKVMLNEALVRAAVIKYMKDNNYSAEKVIKEINTQLSSGFYWIEDLVKELDSYDNQRQKYKSLETYMPVLQKAYEKYAENINNYILRFDKKRPKVISINEFQNGDKSVNSSLQSITINFDKPLIPLDAKYATNYGGNRKGFPEIKTISFSKNKKSITIYCKLDSQKDYNILLTNKLFKSMEGISIKDYEIKFKTN